MSIFGFVPDINLGLQQYKSTQGALLLDVREADEYASGHIPGSVNLPFSRLRDADDLVEDPETPLFIYCLSGGRSSRATALLIDMGYPSVTNIGGICAYKGEMER